MSESYFTQIITKMIFNFPKQKLYIYENFIMKIIILYFI